MGHLGGPREVRHPLELRRGEEAPRVRGGRGGASEFERHIGKQSGVDDGGGSEQVRDAHLERAHRAHQIPVRERGDQAPARGGVEHGRRSVPTATARPRGEGHVLAGPIAFILFVLVSQQPATREDRCRLVDEDVLARPKALEALPARHVRDLVPVVLDEAVARAKAEGEPIVRLAAHEHLGRNVRAHTRPRIEALAHVWKEGRGVIVWVVRSPRGRIRVARPDVLVAVRRGRVASVHHDDGLVLAEAAGTESDEEGKVACVELWVDGVVRAARLRVGRVGIACADIPAGQVRWRRPDV